MRELKSVIDRLVLFHEGPVLREGWWEPPARIVDPTPPEAPVAAAAAPARPEDMVLPGRGGRIALAKKLLATENLSLADIAARTGVHPTTLFRWRKSGKV